MQTHNKLPPRRVKIKSILPVAIYSQIHDWPIVTGVLLQLHCNAAPQKITLQRVIERNGLTSYLSKSNCTQQTKAMMLEDIEKYCRFCTQAVFPILGKHAKPGFWIKIQMRQGVPKCWQSLSLKCISHYCITNKPSLFECGNMEHKAIM